jgi:hypothetical protein
MPVWINLAHALEQDTINNATVIHGNIRGACASVTGAQSNAPQRLLSLITSKVEVLQDALGAACLCGSIVRMPWSKTYHKTMQ